MSQFDAAPQMKENVLEDLERSLEEAGVEVKLPPFDVSNYMEEIKGLKLEDPDFDAQLIAKIEELHPLLKAFDGLILTKEQDKALAPKLRALEARLREVYDLASDRAYEKHPDGASKEYRDALRSITSAFARGGVTGNQFMRGRADDSFLWVVNYEV